MDIQAEREYWPLFFETTEDLFIEYDNQLRYCYLNPTAYSVLGLQAEAVIGKSNWEILSDFNWQDTNNEQPNNGKNYASYTKACLQQTLSQTELYLQRVVSTGQKQTVLQEIATATGIKFYQITYTPVADKQGNLLRIFCLGRDVTEYNQSQSLTGNNLAITKDFLWFNNTNTPLALIGWDEDCRFVYWSRRAEEIFGWKAEEVLGKSFFDFRFIWEEDLDAIRVGVKQIISGLGHSSINRNYTKSGEIIWCHWYNSAIRLGNTSSVISLVEDITENKKLELSLKEALQRTENSEKMLRTIINATSDWIFVKDRNFRYSLVNATGVQVIGKSIEEILGKDDIELGFTKEEIFGTSDENNIRDFPSDEEAVLRGEIIHNSFDPVTFADGYHHIFDTYKMPLRDGSSEIVGIVGFARDVTHRYQAEYALRQNEEQFRSLVTNLLGVVYRCQYQGGKKITFISEAVLTLTGYPAEDFLENRVRTFASIIHPEDVQKVEEMLWESLQNKSNYTIEYRICTRDGAVKWVWEKGCALEGEYEEFLFVDGVILDITDRKKIEDKLKEKNAEQEALFKALPDLYFRLEADSTILDYVAGSLSEIYLSPELFLGKRMLEVLPKPAALKFEEGIRETLATGSLVTIEYCLQMPNSEEFYEARLVPFVDNQIIVIVRTISDYRNAQKALEQSEAKLRKLTDNVPGMVCEFITEKNGQSLITFASSGCEELYGLKAEQIMENADLIWQRIYQEDQRSLETSFFHSAQTLEPWKWQGRIISPDGKIKWIESASKPEKQSNGDILWYGLVIDITSRKQAEEALRVSEAKFRNFVENANDIIYALSPAGVFLYISPNWFDILGHSVEEVEGKEFATFVHPEDLQKCWDFLAKLHATGQKQTGVEYRVKHKNGTWRWHRSNASTVKDENGKVLYYIGIARDITERVIAEAELTQKNQQLEETLQQLRSYQAQLVQAEKISSLGQLVAGVAHEINNPVNFIYGNINPLREYTADLLHLLQLYQQHSDDLPLEIRQEIDSFDVNFIIEDIYKILGSMNKGAERIKNIVLNLRNFARSDEADKKNVDIHQGIDSTLMLLRNRLKDENEQEKIQVIKEYGNLPLVECYPGQLNQVFINILNNALDALEEKTEPRIIRIKTEVVAGETSAKPDRVTVNIWDNGIGISPEYQLKLFDPFFTTKPVGKGTGLGLFSSYQIIVQKHSGAMVCSSQLGQGTEFKIEIPIKAVKNEP